MPLPTADRAPTWPARRLASARVLRVLLWVGALFPALTIVVLASVALARSRAQYEQRAELLTQNLAAALDRSVSANIEKVDLTLTTLVDHLEAQLESSQLNPVALSALLRLQIQHRPELESLRITDAQGHAILGSDLPGPGLVDFSDREWFVAQRDRAQTGLYMSHPLVSKYRGDWIVSFSRRYRTPQGRFAGAVSAALPLTFFERELRAVDVGPLGTVVVRDAALGLLARCPAAQVGAPAQSVSATQVGAHSVSPQLRALAASGRPQATFHATATSDSVERTLSFRRLSAAPLLVIVGLGTQDYLADWYSEVRAVALSCGAIVVLYCAGVLVLLRVVAQNRQARARIDLLARVFEHSGEAIVLTNREGQIVEVNPAFERQTGYAAREVDGIMLDSFAAHASARAQYATMWSQVQSLDLWRGEVWDRTHDGRAYPKWMSVSAVRDATGSVTHHVASSIDVTHVKQTEEKILHAAHHDALTQLPNRVYLHVRLDQAIPSALLEGSGLAMLFIDMDRFKNINDTLGHHVGDRLLIEVGQRLRGIVRAGDIVARLGGDEFVLVLTGIRADPARAGASVANKVLTVLGAPYQVDGHELHSTPSIGVGIFPADGDTADTLMKNADTAMYHAKSNGRNNFQFFTPAMHEATVERLALEVGLRHAIERGELFVQYQAQQDTHTGRIVGFEALVRWQHPERGLIGPLKFIPIAEDTGLIEQIGAWVLQQALAQVARWRGVHGPTLRVAVNLSAQQIRGDAFPGQVARALREHGLPGQALELEITESVAMRDPARTAALLRELRSHGVALAIDDFGTGYSSLAYLKQLPLSCLKLDRSFVMDIEHDPNDAAICKATIQLAHSLGLAVVAEGVENLEQFTFLRALGCDVVQGYFISRPISAQACDAFLQRDAPAMVEPAALA
jgi:diguanylate cyclase (GGDEF)-like protein/PAS domain S-box-containing protein